MYASAKHPRDKFPLSDNIASRIFKKIHYDLWGLYRHVSSCGACYFLIIYFTFMSFVVMVDRQFSQAIKIVQSDNGIVFHSLFDYIFYRH